MIPTSWHVGPVVAPPAQPITPLRVRTREHLQQLFSHLPGITVGTLVYSYLTAYGWFVGTVFVTYNRCRKGLRRTARGIEDGPSTTTN